MAGQDGLIIRGQIIHGSLTEPIPDGAVVVIGERIAWVGAWERVPEKYSKSEMEIDQGAGRTVLPGLIDGHIHISFGEAQSEEELALYTPVEYRSIKAMWNARKVLRAGVTSSFDAASTFNIAVSVRDAVRAGMFEGPRMTVCGRQLTTHQGLEDAFPSWMEFPIGQAGVLVRNQDEILEAVRLQIKDGVDFIKVSGSSDSAVFNEPIEGSAFRPEEFDLIADETHRLHRKCTVHARSRESVLYSAKAGFDSIMHASYIDDEGIEACLKNGVAITPTLTLLYNMIDSAEGDVGASAIDVFKREVDAAADGLSRAFKAGVPLIAGSESGWSLVPFGHWHGKEMEIFVELLGMTPLEAIHAATAGAARTQARHSDEIGVLESGRLADLIVVNGDPLKDIKVFQQQSRFHMVMQGGQIVDRTTPIPEPPRWAYERHRLYLPGNFVYNENKAGGETVAAG